MNERIKCENCIYWGQLKGMSAGSCVRHPSFLYRKDVKTMDDWYCGHFTDKETNKSYRDLYFEGEE